jgi:YbbR domain-containing protein
VKGLRRWLRSNAALILFALALAVFTWIVAAEEDDPTVTDTFPRPVPVQPVGLLEGLVMVGELDEEVAVTVRAPQSVWDRLDLDDFRATADLSGLDQGTHQVPIRVEVDADPATVEYTPDRVTVELEVDGERVLPVDAVEEGSLAVGYTVVTAAISPDEATVSGPWSYVSRVEQLVAVIDLANATANFERDVPLTALDADGQPVPYLTITPEVVYTSVEVEHSVNYKALAVAAPQRIGEVAPGYQITGVSVDPPAVTVFGSTEVIAALPSFIEVEPIDIDGAEEDVVAEAQLLVPQGVTLSPGEAVEITISVDPIPGSKSIEVPVELTGLGEGLSADLYPDKVEVFLSGPLPILDGLTESDIRVILDLTGLDRGTHSLEPAVETPEGTTVQSLLPATVRVEITRAATPTPGGA